MTARLVVDGLTVDVRTEHGTARVVDDVSFTVEPGECVAIVGESGAGKTLTARAVLGLLPRGATIVAGEVHWRDRDLARTDARSRRGMLGSEIAYVPQEPALDPVMRIGKQLVEAMRVHGVRAGDARRRAPGLLSAVGIADASRRLRSYPHQLSGGMQQRVMVALALANDPELVIADEPTTGLDVITQTQVLELLERLRHAEGRSLLLVTHDLGVVAGVADRVLVMYAGRIVEESRAEVLFARPRHPYTAGLLGAVPRLGDRRDALRAIPGAAPQPGRLPVGCVFHPRCRYAEPSCLVLAPRLDPVDADTRVACIRVDAIQDAVARWVQR